MAEISKTASLSLSAIYPRGSQAESLVALAREAGGNPPRSVDLDGVSLRADRVAVAASARFSAQVETLRQAAANAADAASVLDVADAALSQISGKLARLEQLADTGARTPIENADGSTYTPSELSAQERAILEAEFDDIKAAIDGIAGTTSFDGTDLLQGDAGNPDDPLTLTFQVGGKPPQEVAVSINRADVAGLSANLESASLLTEEGSVAAEESIVEAQIALDEIRAAVRGARAQIANVSAAAGEVSEIVSQVRDAKATPEAAIDLSRLVADQVSEEGGVHLVEGAQQILQDVLLRASAVSGLGTAKPSGGDGVEEFGGKTSGGPAPAATASSNASDAGADD